MQYTRTLYADNPLRPGLDALSWWLEQQHYSQHAREMILARTAEEGTPSGCVYLEGEDEAAASECFVAALPAVPYDSPQWGEADLIEAVPPVAGGGPFEPSAEDWDDYRRHCEEMDRRERERERHGPEWGYE